jgi:hypothetical protein
LSGVAPCKSLAFLSAPLSSNLIVGLQL